MDTLKVWRHKQDQVLDSRSDCVHALHLQDNSNIRNLHFQSWIQIQIVKKINFEVKNKICYRIATEIVYRWSE